MLYNVVCPGKPDRTDVKHDHKMTSRKFALQINYRQQTIPVQLRTVRTDWRL